MNKKNLYLILSYISFFIGVFFLGNIIGIFQFIISILFYSLITYMIYGGYKKLKSKEYIFFSKENIVSFFYSFLKKVANLLWLLIIIIGGFSYYQNDINPAFMPMYTLSNGDKTVVFQSMSHIGSEKFYRDVKNKIIIHKNDDFVLFFEGVQPGTQENQEAFDKALGVKFNENTYKTMSKIYGLTHQNNELFLGHINDKDYNVDVSIDDIMNQYQELKTVSGQENRTYQPPIDVEKELLNELSKLNENQLKVLRYINKSFINFIIKSKSIQTTIQNEFTNKELFEVILHKRNEVIADTIINSEEKKIFAIYGLLHFEGIFQILKQHDIKWQIQKIDYLYPIQ